jgi:hypothetical protein
MMTPIQIIFPMAGEGSRFGYCFKPLLKATEETFIELAVKPFTQLKDYGYIVEYIFVYRKIQEEQYKVSTKLASLFPTILYKCCLIDSSEGPLQTVQKAIQQQQLKGAAFICDCDHSIDIFPMIQNLNNDLLNYEVLIPTWKIRPEEYFSWGKVKLTTTTEILDFCEKELLQPDKNEVIKGLIGCYCFADISTITSYPNYPDISSLLKDMLKNDVKMKTIDIQKADFFGTPKQLEHFRFLRTKQYTLFLDIDGVLVHQETKALIVNTIEKIHTWKKEGHRIVLTTASPLSMTKIIVEKYHIPYDEILADLTPGPRIIINDRKPYLPYYIMADGITLERNEGIQHIQLSHYDPPLILKELKGASFAKIYLVEKEGKKFVRKFILKTDLLQLEALKRQYEDLKRWHYYSKGFVPTLLTDIETTSYYAFDMEYLDGYETLSTFSKPYPIIQILLERLFQDVYCYKKPLKQPIQWLEEYLEIKVFPKFASLPSLSPAIESLIHHQGIYINSVFYPSLPELLKNIPYHEMSPQFICPIHGDLTLENIMVHPESKDIKLIDHAGSRYVDAIELDLGKLFQSIICNYHLWKEYPSKVTLLSRNHYTIPELFIHNQDKYKDIQSILEIYDSNTKLVFLKGLYYMSTYFIRMVPFMYAQSEDQALFILLLAHIHLAYVRDSLM